MAKQQWVQIGAVLCLKMMAPKASKWAVPAIKIPHWRGGQCNFDMLWIVLSSPLGNVWTMGQGNG